MKKIIIAIDGPAGTGKSTIAKLLSEQINVPYLDTGAFYRCVSLYKIRHNDCDLECLKEFARTMQIEFKNMSGNKYVYLNGEDVTNKIRTPEIAKVVSDIADMSELRKVINERLREMAQINGAILEGRDIQTLVFPDADYKFFLTATPEERAQRRLKDYVKSGKNLTFEEVLADIKRRDDRDYNREYGPLKMAEDAILIDTTNLSIEEVLNKIKSYIKFT